MSEADFEMRLRINYDETQDCIEVCEDGDGLGLVEIRYRDENEKIHARITLQPQQVPLLVRSLGLLQQFLVERASLEKTVSPKEGP